MTRTMKIMGTVVVMAALLMLGIPAPVLAQEVPVTVNAPPTATSGSSFTAAIDIGQVSELNAAQYDIWFDPLVLHLNDVTDGLIDSTTISADFNDFGGGHCRVVNSMGTGNVTGSGYLAVLHFQAIGDPGTSSDINFTDGLLADINMNNVPATWTGDTVNIVEPTPGANFRIEPPSQTVGIGQIFEVEIWVDASTQEVDTVQAYVDFDTTYIQAVDEFDNIIAGTASDVIIPGDITTTHLTTKLDNQVDNDNGYADIAYGMPPGGTPANTDFLFGTVRFMAMAETASTALVFHTSGLRYTMAIRSFNDVTGTISGGEVTIVPCVPLNISVTLQGRPPAPNAQWIIPVEVWFHAPDAPWTEEVGNGSLFYFQTTTTNDGIIELCVEPGTYDIRVKGLTTLKNIAFNVDIYPPGTVEVDLGTLLEGDVNGDNMVTGLDYSAVIMCFGYAVDDPQAPVPTPRCDFNNDGYVTGLDYSAVIMNFGLGGADI